MIKKLFIVLGSTLLFWSCEENFSPKTDFVEKYVLYSIINPDSSIQTAYLQKSYFVDGYDPYLNTEDPSIKGAEIRLRQKNNVFFLRDTSIEITDTSRYKSPVNFYYTKDFYTIGSDSIEILVTLSNGIKLYSITNMAPEVEFEIENNKIIPAEEQDHVKFFWNLAGQNSWYLPKFVFYYTKDNIRYEKEVATEYILKDGNWTASFPAITQSNVIRYFHYAIDSAFAEISKNDPDKNRYKILGGVLNLLVFNESLSSYFSSTNGYLDDFTIRLDESDYSNINGGLGVLGTVRKQTFGAKFTEAYIISFGYQSGLGN